MSAGTNHVAFSKRRLAITWQALGPVDYSGQGVNAGRSLLTPVDLEVASREELAESASANVGAREFSGLKQAIPKFSGLPEDFPVWSKRFQAFTSMNGGSMNGLESLEAPAPHWEILWQPARLFYDLLEAALALSARSSLLAISKSPVVSELLSALTPCPE